MHQNVLMLDGNVLTDLGDGTEHVIVACEEAPCDIILLTNMEIIFIHFQVRLLWLKVCIKHTDLSS